MDQKDPFQSLNVSLRQMTKDIVPVMGAGTAAVLCVPVIVTCAPDAYIVIAAHSSVTWS